MKAVLAFALCAATSASLLHVAPTQIGWTTVGSADSNRVIKVMFSLKKDLSQHARQLELRSTPGSPLFRQWLSHEEEASMVKMADAAPVHEFLASHGVTGTTYGDLIKAEMDAATAQRVFSTQINQIKHTESGVEWHQAGDVHVPQAVADVIVGVYGLHGIPALPKAKNPRQAMDNEFPIGPTEIRARYQVPNATRGNGNATIKQAVAEFQGQFQSTPDLQSFFSQYVPNAQAGDDQIYAFKGPGANQSGDGVEAELDIQYIMGNAPGVLTEFWEQKNFDFCSDLKAFTQQILSDPAAPAVFSISYGLQSDVSLFCANYQDIDNDFMRVANKGISIIFASGDSGVGYDPNSGDIYPSWPAISPYVTSVGSTCFTNSSFVEEQTTIQFGSGSGFSALDALQTWQTTVVNNYLAGQQGMLPAANLYKTFMGNMLGRATADVSALGEGYKVVSQGSTIIVGGTSAATPTFAALISLINTELNTMGKPPMGYLNPFIYQNGAAFFDVTIGSDKINRAGGTVPYGFNAAPSWDPPSGFGTPNYPALLTAAEGNL